MLLEMSSACIPFRISPALINPVLRFNLNSRFFQVKLSVVKAGVLTRVSIVCFSLQTFRWCSSRFAILWYNSLAKKPALCTEISKNRHPFRKLENKKIGENQVMFCLFFIFVYFSLLFSPVSQWLSGVFLFCRNGQGFCKTPRFNITTTSIQLPAGEMPGLEANDATMIQYLKTMDEYFCGRMDTFKDAIFLGGRFGYF